MINNISAIILAGGESKRMGQDKAFIHILDKPLIEVLIDELKQIFEDIIIITNKPQLYEGYDLATYSDIIKSKGPLGGIYTGLVNSKNEYNFVIACDMPFVDGSLIEYMSREFAGFDAVVARSSKGLEPLYGFYSKKCIEPIANVLKKDSLKITDFLDKINLKIVDWEGECFLNINTEDDYKCMLEKMALK